MSAPTRRARRGFLSAPPPGFSLVEMIVAMSLMGVLLGLSAQLFRKQSGAVSRQAGRLDAQQNSRFALASLDRDLRVAGVGVVDVQPLLVQVGPLAITFNADLVALDTGDLGAVYINPDADSSSAGVLRASQAVALPITRTLYPDTTYMQAAGVPSNAETISYWLSQDSTSGHANEYIMFRRVDASPPNVVARGIVVNPTDTVFQYFKGDTTGALSPVSPALLPLTHSAVIHGATSDTGRAALIDSIRQVNVHLTSVYHDPRTGKDTYRTLRTTIHIMNAGLIHHSTCGNPPLAPGSVAASATPADSVHPQTQVTVTWTPSLDDGSGEKDVERYAIYRRLDTAATFDAPVASVPAGSASYSFTDTDVLSGQTWIYGVSAQDCTPASSPMTTASALIIP